MSVSLTLDSVYICHKRFCNCYYSKQDALMYIYLLTEGILYTQWLQKAVFCAL